MQISTIRKRQLLRIVEVGRFNYSQKLGGFG